MSEEFSRKNYICDGSNVKHSRKNSCERKKQFDKTDIEGKTFEGQLILTRNPSLHSKLYTVWDGTFEVSEV